jgi:hypothetical protein
LGGLKQVESNNSNRFGCLSGCLREERERREKQEKERHIIQNGTYRTEAAKQPTLCNPLCRIHVLTNFLISWKEGCMRDRVGGRESAGGRMEGDFLVFSRGRH